MNTTHDLAGSHRALFEVARVDEFKEWLEETQINSFENCFEGYRLLVRSAFQMFQEDLHQNRRTLDIQSNIEYERGHAQIADIDALRPDCDASKLIKNLDRVDKEINTTHNYETLSEGLSKLRKDVIEPFGNLFSRVEDTSTEASKEKITHFLAIHSLVTSSNETMRGYPEAFQWGWIYNRFSRETIDSSFEGYKIALFWIYTKLSPDTAEMGELEEPILEADNWDELDYSYKSVREELLEPLESKFEENRSELYNISNVDSHDEILHLIEDAPNTAVGVEKSLNRLFLWDSANKASDVIYGSGSAGFITILLGIQQVRRRLDVDDPIRIRRIIHPEEPGNSYSYAICLSGWSLQGTGTLHGWAVFVRIATDYSGFGGSQHRLIEEYLEELSSDKSVMVKEIGVKQERLDEYLSHQGTRVDFQQFEGRGPEYDNRLLADILRSGEDTRTEFKSKISSPDQIAAEIGALANHNGGLLLIGIDDEGEPVGVENIDKTDNIISSIISDKLVPPLSADIHRESVRGKDIAIVKIPDSDRPVAFDYRYYGRKGANKRKLTYAELKERYG